MSPRNRFSERCGVSVPPTRRRRRRRRRTIWGAGPPSHPHSHSPFSFPIRSPTHIPISSSQLPRSQRHLQMKPAGLWHSRGGADHYVPPAISFLFFLISFSSFSSCSSFSSFACLLLILLLTPFSLPCRRPTDVESALPYLMGITRWPQPTS